MLFRFAFASVPNCIRVYILVNTDNHINFGMQRPYEFVFEFIGVAFCLQDDLEYKEYSYNEPTKDLPLKIFEAPPPYGKRIVTINIETEGSDKVSLIFAGRIYEYRDRFQAKEIPGGFPGSGDGEEKGKYCRVMKSVDVSSEDEIEKVWLVMTKIRLRVSYGFWDGV